MIKVTTQHGTHYIIDTDNNKALRVKGDGRNDMSGDGEWFNFAQYRPYDRTTGEFGTAGDIQVGQILFFDLYGHRDYDWRCTTSVSAVEEV